MQQFKHEHYAMLLVNNPAAARKYIKPYQPEQEIAKAKREEMVSFCKKHWVKVFPNYKDETVEKMYSELKEKLAEAV